MSRLIGVVLMVFALTFGMTLAGCGDKKSDTPEVKDVEPTDEKDAEGSDEKGKDAAKDDEKKAD